MYLEKGKEYRHFHNPVVVTDVLEEMRKRHNARYISVLERIIEQIRKYYEEQYSKS